MNEDLLSKDNTGGCDSKKDSCKTGNESKGGNKAEGCKYHNTGGFDTVEESLNSSAGKDAAASETNDTEMVDPNTHVVKKAVEAETANLIKRLQRAQADFINYKKRVERTRFQDKVRYEGQLILDLLPILDNLERALNVDCSDEDPDEDKKRFIKGLDLIIRQFKELLFKKGLEEITALDKQFDPYCHEAVEQVMDENIANNLIVEVLQKGYMFGERVLRPSLVKVNIGGMEDE